ncbi:MAG: ubiquinol-cytochrome c reductase iron-sulfur subunit [Halobacteriales archaeon]
MNWLAGLGIAGFFAGLVTPLKDLSVVAEKVGKDSEKTNLPGQQLVFAHAHEKDPQHVHAAGNYVKADHLGVPDAALVYPEDLSQDDNYLILLHRLNPDEIQPPTKQEMTDQGYVAYSAICTHLGCTVNWTTKSHAVGGPHDHCPCHVGEFDPYHGAEVVGGPPPKPLPQIGVTVNDDGILEVTSKFEETVGGE